MGKQDLINPTSKDRNSWPVEARVCEKIWILCKKLRESNIMTEYLDGKLSDEAVDLVLHEHDNFNMIQDIIDLKQECSKFVLCSDEDSKNGEIKYFKLISELGTILASDCKWWDRYETITRTMGVDCVLSIRTAVSLFNRDPKAAAIKNVLSKLLKEDI